MTLLGLAVAGFFFIAMLMGPNGPPVGLILFMTLFVGFFFALAVIPSFLAGYGLLKRRSWARIAAIIGAVAAATNAPIGTAVCVYTFWFLFSEPGKAIFENRKYMLPPGRQSWAYDVQNKERETVYTPPATPPDWR
jgi:hypothetical protein